MKDNNHEVGRDTPKKKLGKEAELNFKTDPGKHQTMVDKGFSITNKCILGGNLEKLKAGLSAGAARVQAVAEEMEQKYNMADRAKSGYRAAKKEAKKTAKVTICVENTRSYLPYFSN